jgi:spermidine synthase
LSPDSLGLLTLARLGVGFAVLLVPTVLMGLTLPVLSASSLVRGPRFGPRLSALYAVNTAGAVAGAMVAGYYLIGAIGISRSFLVAAAVNGTVGVVALMASRRADVPPAFDARTPSSDEQDASAAVAERPPVGTIGAIVAISGLAALALEIVWFRMLLQYLAATTYAFTTMLATVLAGLALGGAIASPLLRRRRDWVAWLAALQLLTAISVLTSAIFLGWSYRAGWRTTGDWQASASAILLVATLMGMSLPVALRVAAAPRPDDSAGTIARRVGALYSLNVLGAIAGALVGGFVLLPVLGVRRGLTALAAVYALTGIALVLGHARRLAPIGATVVAVVAFALLAVRVPDPFSAAYERRYGRDMREFWRDEGVQTAVSVHASQFRRSLYLDGLHQANDTPDMVRLHRTIGLLPLVLHPAPTDALVVGLGGGATSGAVSQHHGTRVQIVELSESVRRAAPFFAHVNYDVLNRPNVRLRVDDGRNFLLLSGETFDVITADIIQPIHAGAGNLYSREYFTLVRRALKPHGVALQWIGQRPPFQYKLLMRTFLDVFPHATLWLDGNLLVGSLEPLQLDRSVFDGKRRDPETRAALDEIGLTSFEVLCSWYTAGPQELRRYAGEGPVLTDDRPLLEYHLSLPDDPEPLDLSPLRGDVSRIIRR